MKKVELNDFKAQWALIHEQVHAAVERTGESGWLILGKEVQSFESDLSKAWGLPHAVGCANGLDAIEIGLRALGLRPGEPVLTTPMSAFATTLAILRAGGRPVFVDTDEQGLIDLDLVAKALESRRDIRFMVPVHLFGFPLDLDRLAALQKRFGIRIVEDCAQSIGAAWGGRPTGSVGEIAATSFYPTKNLGCLGDGGALLTQDPALAQTARQLRDYGQEAKYVHRSLGLNSRLDELQAAILRDALLPRLAGWTRRRTEIADTYRQRIRNPRLRLPQVPAQAAPAWHLFPVFVEADRGGFQEHLLRRAVSSGVHYPLLITAQPALSGPGASAETLTPLTRAEAVAQRELSLPIHPLLTAQEVETVISACNDWKAS